MNQQPRLRVVQPGENPPISASSWEKSRIERYQETLRELREKRSRENNEADR